MFFVFDSVPELPRLDFRNSTNISPDSFASLQQFLQSRIDLQKFSSNPSKIQSSDLEKQSENLMFSVDLLELCEKEQIVPEGAIYKGFLKNKGKALRLFYNPDVVLTVDLIYSRYAFAFATLRSAKDEMDNIRKVIHQLDVYNDLIKNIIEKARFANTRIFKLHYFQHLIFSALGSNSQLFELNHLTVQQLDVLCRINFASILIIKALSSSLSPEKLTFLAQLSKKSWSLCQEGKIFWERVGSAETQLIADFYEIATQFFFMMSMFSVIRCNLYENDGLLKKNKDYKTTIWENYVLSEEIRKIVKQVSQTSFKSNDIFNIDENKRAFSAFYEVFMGSLTEEAIKSYGYLANELGNIPRNQPLAIVNSIGLTGDFIDKILKGDS